MSVPSQPPPYYGSTQTYIYYPDPALPLSTVNYCAQSCAIPLFRVQPNDRSAADSVSFNSGKTLYSSQSNNYNVYQNVSTVGIVYTSAPGGGKPFPIFRSHTDYVKYKRMQTLLTQNYASDTQL